MSYVPKFEEKSGLLEPDPRSKKFINRYKINTTSDNKLRAWGLQGHQGLRGVQKTRVI